MTIPTFTEPKNRQEYISHMRKIRSMREARAKSWCIKKKYIYCQSFRDYFLYKKTDNDYTTSMMYVDLWSS